MKETSFLEGAMAAFQPVSNVYCVARQRWYFPKDVFDGRDWLVKRWPDWFAPSSLAPTVGVVEDGPAIPNPPVGGGSGGQSFDPSVLTPLQNQLDDLKAKLAQAQSKVDGLGSRVGKAETDAGKAVEAAGQVQSKMNEVDGKLAKIDGLDTAVAKLEQVEGKVAAVEGMAAEHTAVKQKVDALEALGLPDVKNTVDYLDRLGLKDVKDQVLEVSGQLVLAKQSAKNAEIIAQGTSDNFGEFKSTVESKVADLEGKVGQVDASAIKAAKDRADEAYNKADEAQFNIASMNTSLAELNQGLLVAPNADFEKWWRPGQNLREALQGDRGLFMVTECGAGTNILRNNSGSYTRVPLQGPGALILAEPGDSVSFISGVGAGIGGKQSATMFTQTHATDIVKLVALMPKSYQ